MAKTRRREPLDPDPVPLAEGTYDPRTTSVMCVRGKHHRCRGKVYAPSTDDTGYVHCTCPVPDCGHGHED